MSKTILVIDDDDMFRKFIRSMLEEHGYSVVEASDGKAGIEILEQRRVDLAITDLVMPQTEGIETIRAIRQKKIDLPILAISGAPDYLKAAQLLGATSVMEKLRIPYDLPGAIEALLSKHPV